MYLTIAQLKQGLDDYAKKQGLDENTPVVVGVGTRTTHGAQDYQEIYSIGFVYGLDSICLSISLSEELSIRKNKK